MPRTFGEAKLATAERTKKKKKKVNVKKNVPRKRLAPKGRAKAVERAQKRRDTRAIESKLRRLQEIGQRRRRGGGGGFAPNPNMIYPNIKSASQIEREDLENKVAIEKARQMLRGAPDDPADVIRTTKVARATVKSADAASNFRARTEEQQAQEEFLDANTYDAATAERIAVAADLKLRAAKAVRATLSQEQQLKFKKQFETVEAEAKIAAAGASISQSRRTELEQDPGIRAGVSRELRGLYGTTKSAVQAFGKDVYGVAMGDVAKQYVRGTMGQILTGQKNLVGGVVGAVGQGARAAVAGTTSALVRGVGLDPGSRSVSDRRRIEQDVTKEQTTRQVAARAVQLANAQQLRDFNIDINGGDGGGGEGPGRFRRFMNYLSSSVRPTAPEEDPQEPPPELPPQPPPPPATSTNMEINADEMQGAIRSVAPQRRDRNRYDGIMADPADLGLGPRMPPPPPRPTERPGRPLLGQEPQRRFAAPAATPRPPEPPVPVQPTVEDDSALARGPVTTPVVPPRVAASKNGRSVENVASDTPTSSEDAKIIGTVRKRDEDSTGLPDDLALEVRAIGRALGRPKPRKKSTPEAKKALEQVMGDLQAAKRVQTSNLAAPKPPSLLGDLGGVAESKRNVVPTTAPASAPAVVNGDQIASTRAAASTENESESDAMELEGADAITSAQRRAANNPYQELSRVRFRPVAKTGTDEDVAESVAGRYINSNLV